MVMSRLIPQEKKYKFLKKGVFMKIKQIFSSLLILMMSFMPLCLAHESRSAGKYTVIVGFVNEPAFNGAMNGLDLRVTKDGKPVEGLEQTLKAEVSHKDSAKPLALTLRKRYKQPGVYAGYFLPEKPGAYTFHVTGTLEGRPFDQTFKPGKGFHDVEDSAPLRFPAA